MNATATTIEGDGVSDRPVIDLGHAQRFIAVGGWTDPVTVKGLADYVNTLGWQAMDGSVNLKNLVFKRGKTPNPRLPISPGSVGEDWGEYGLLTGMEQKYQCQSPFCTCNKTALGLASNASCPDVYEPLGCGGVVFAYAAKMVIHNCDFLESFGLMGGAICNFGSDITISGDALTYPSNQAVSGYRKPGAQQHTDYQAYQYEKGTKSYCNFEANLAWNSRLVGSGGAIFLGNTPAWQAGVNAKLTITGCNFFRNMAWHPKVGAWGNGGVISTMHMNGFLFTVANTSFYENWARRGGVVYIGDTRGAHWGGNGKSQNTLTATWEGVTAVRNGYWDLDALQGCDKDISDQYNLPCNAFLPPGNAHGLPESYGGLRGVYQNTGDDLKWPTTPGPYITPENTYKGKDAMGIDPLEGNACDGFTQTGGTYDANFYPKEFYQNCGTPGAFTKMNYDLWPRDGSYIQGVVTQNGGVWYSLGTNSLIFSVKKSDFIQNRASFMGGSFYFGDAYARLMGSIMFQDTRFIRNRARDGGAVTSAMMMLGANYTNNQPGNYVNVGPVKLPSNAFNNSKLVLERCELRANMALKHGAAICVKLPRNSGQGTSYVVDQDYEMVRPPECPLYKDANQNNLFDKNPCPAVKMFKFQLQLPAGTKGVLEIIGTPQADGSAVTATNADSKVVYNIGSMSGAIWMGAQTSPGIFRANMDAAAEFVASDTYFGDNGARMADYDETITGRAADGGVLTLQNDNEKRSTSCYPLMSSHNPFTCGNGSDTNRDNCPSGRYGACNMQVPGCYDACAFERYMPIENYNGLKSSGLATVFDTELNHKVTFTRCGISKNVAHRHGGVVFATQTLRDAATITFDRCKINNNGPY